MNDRNTQILDGIPYHRHPNGGGWVAETASVEPTVHVGPLCYVFGTAKLSEHVRLTGNAKVGGTVVADGSVIFAQYAYRIEGEFHGTNTIIT